MSFFFRAVSSTDRRVANFRHVNSEQCDKGHQIVERIVKVLVHKIELVEGKEHKGHSKVGHHKCAPEIT